MERASFGEALFSWDAIWAILTDITIGSTEEVMVLDADGSGNGSWPPTRPRRPRGIYSGSEVYLILPALVTVPREHATTIVGAGDVGFLTVEKGSGYCIEEGYSEVCWFYESTQPLR